MLFRSERAMDIEKEASSDGKASRGSRGSRKGFPTGIQALLEQFSLGASRPYCMCEASFVGSATILRKQLGRWLIRVNTRSI